MRLLLRTLVVVLLLAGAAAGALLWRLAQGPVSLAPIQPVLEAVIDRGQPYQVSFTDPMLVWLREEGSLGFGARDVEVRTRDGDFLGGAPSIRAVIALSPLFERRVEPEVLELELPELELVREVDGRLVLGFAGQLTALPLRPGEEGSGLAALLGEGTGGIASDEISLRRVRVSAPALIYVDAATGERATASDARLEFSQEEGVWTASLETDFEGGTVRVLVRPGRVGSPYSVTVEVERFPLQALAALLPQLPVLDLELPVSGNVAFTIDRAGLVPGAATVAFTTERATVGAAAYGLAPIDIERAVLEAALEPGWQRARIHRLELGALGFEVRIAGQVGRDTRGIQTDLSLTASDLDVKEILTLWPQALAGGARAWIASNVLAGRVSRAALQTGQGSPRPDQPDLGGSFAFSEAEIRYLDTFPTATGVAGFGNFAGDSLDLTLERGETGKVEATGGRVGLTNMIGAADPQLKVRLDLRSSVPAALDLLDHEPIGLLAATGLSLQGAAGQQTTRLEVGLPLIEDLPVDRIRYQATTQVTALQLRNVRPGYDLTARELKLSADASGLSTGGEVQVNGVPVNVVWRESFGDGRGPRRQIDLQAGLTPAAVRSLRFDWPAWLSGAVGVTAKLVESRRATRTVDLALDLGPTGIQVPSLLLTKLPAQPGRASARLIQETPERLTVEQVSIEAGSVTAEGSLGLRLEPVQPDRIAVTTLRSKLGDLSADLTLQDRTWRGAVDIGRLDLRPLRQGSGTEGGSDWTIPDLALVVSARTLRLGDAPLTNLKGSVERQGGIWSAARIRGNIEDSEVALDLQTRQQQSALTLRSNDAGWLIRGFASSDNGVRGGQFRLSGDFRQRPEGTTGAGELKIRDFTLYGAPLIARIVSLASFTGLTNALSGRGVPVQRLVVPFELEGERLTLNQARLVAADIGARADGTIDLETGALTVNGTVAPAYTVNRILGRIPILGQILSGSGSDAAIAATFSVSNTLADPQITVNPLAALVPGMVRDLFSALTADAPGHSVDER